MVFIPGRGEVPDPAVGLTGAAKAELYVNRLNTKAFISQDPIDVTLLRPTVGRSATGARKRVSATVVPTQRFKLIMVSPAGGSIDQNSEDGTVVRVDYILLGEWDADVANGDYWDDENGRRWEVKSTIPTNNYEFRANVSVTGDRLVGG